MLDEDSEAEPLDSWEMLEQLGLQSGEPARDLSEPGVMESFCRATLERAVDDGLVRFLPGGPDPRDIPDGEIAGMVGVLRRALERRGLR